MNNTNFIYYVYVYCDQRYKHHFSYENISFLYKPFYIGSGCKQRFISHVKYVMRNLNNNKKLLDGNRHKNLIIKSIYTNLNEIPKINILRYFKTRKEAFEYEKFLIKSIGRENLNTGPLSNLTDGGEGLNNPTKETCKKLGDANRNRVKSVDERNMISQGRQRTLYKTSGNQHWMRKEGNEEAKQVVNDAWKSTQFKPGHKPFNTDKTYEEIYGEERAKEIKEKIGNASYESRSGKNNHMCKSFYLIDPNGNIIDFTGKIKSAREYKDGISFRQVRKLYNKEIHEYEGWRLYEPTR